MRYFVITTADNPRRTVSHRLLQQMGVDYRVVVNKASQVLPAVDLGVPRGRIVVAGVDVSRLHRAGGRLTALRNWLVETQVKAGEWFVLMNDNIRAINMLHSSVDKQDFTTRPAAEWRKAYSTPLDPVDTTHLLEDIRRRCVRLGAVHGGVGHPAGNNYFYCPRRWCLRCYVRGDLCVTVKDQTPWCDPGIMLWDDWYRTLRSLRVSGSVVCCRYASTDRVVDWGRGSIGPYTERTPFHRVDARRLMTSFPGLVDYNRGRDDCLKLVVRSQRQLEQWRKVHA
jgi:hypothetical protein